MRRRRELRDGAWYHITARANRREMIFDSEEMRELFLSVLERAKKRHAFRVENFCIMGNHFHLIIAPAPGQSLSAIMQWIMSVFAMAFNRRHGLSGHVWGGRFFSRILDGLRSFVESFGYVDDNPSRARLVADRREWVWGGLWQRRTGRRGVVDGLLAWQGLLFPEHGPLLLG